MIQANSLYESYAIDTMLRQSDRFLVADLSAFYCSVTKDRCVIGFDDTYVLEIVFMLFVLFVLFVLFCTIFRSMT